jgi:MarR family transcriptional regulator, transcriptional regulator for hemolysin
MSDRRSYERGPRRQLIFQLIETSRLLGGYIEGVAGANGTTRAQWGLLGQLRNNEGVSQAELAAAMGIAPISLTRLIDRTQAQGFIERRPHATDRRINKLFLTKQGRLKVNSLDRQREEIATHVLAGLAGSDIMSTSEILAGIAARAQRQHRSPASSETSPVLRPLPASPPSRARKPVPIP